MSHAHCIKQTVICMKQKEVMIDIWFLSKSLMRSAEYYCWVYLSYQMSMWVVWNSWLLLGFWNNLYFLNSSLLFPALEKDRTNKIFFISVSISYDLSLYLAIPELKLMSGAWIIPVVSCSNLCVILGYYVDLIFISDIYSFQRKLYFSFIHHSHLDITFVSMKLTCY